LRRAKGAGSFSGQRCLLLGRRLVCDHRASLPRMTRLNLKQPGSPFRTRAHLPSAPRASGR
jgi:hypothetical protein